MQDLDFSTEKLSLSDTSEPPSPGIAVPDIVAQAILLELDPRDPSTVTMLLNFRYISRSFRDASWKRSAPVWRPLLRRWTVGEPEYTKLPNASDQILMDLAINPAKPPKTPYKVYRARTLVDRIALAAAARRGDSVEEKDRIESYDTIAMLGTQVYDAIIRLKTVTREDRPDYLSIRRVAHKLEPSLTRGISMELWRNAFDDQKSQRVTIDAMAKSLAPFGTPWKTFDEIESDLQRLTHYCHQHIWLDQASASSKGVDVAMPHLVAASVWHSLFRLGYKVLPSEQVTYDNTYPPSSCHLSALLDVESFRLLATSDPPDRLIPAESMAVMLAAVVERLPAPYTMKARLHLAFVDCQSVTVASENDPPGSERWYICGVAKGGVKELSELQQLLASQSEKARSALDPSVPSQLVTSPSPPPNTQTRLMDLNDWKQCIAMSNALMDSGDVGEDGNRRVLSNSMISFTLAALPAVTTKLSKLPKAESAQLSKEFPTYFPLDEVLTAVFSVYPHDAFLVRKHFHALLSTPKHLRKFHRAFERLLIKRDVGHIQFDSHSRLSRELKALLEFKVGEACIFRSGGDEEFGVVVAVYLPCAFAKSSLEEQKSQVRFRILTETFALDADPDELYRIKPPDRRKWRAARNIIERREILGEWFSSRSTLEYPTYNKTKAWAAVYPED